MGKEGKHQKEEKKGITVKKGEDFSEWYTQLVQKAELIEYTNVSGCYVLRPSAYSMWQKVQEFINPRIAELGVKNAYFPLFIPESLLSKEQEHVKGFTPEVAWVTHSGDTKLNERLAVRPTSETLMYSIFPKWIRSYKDLPLKINQWANVVRWEFKHPMPFLRSREFLWQEGHNAYATQKEVESETQKYLDIYADTYKELFAVPMIKGRKTEREKFAGAVYTLTVETFLPTGKAIQGATSHNLGQNFSKPFNITFLDQNEKSQFVYQNSWGFSTRSLGVMLIMHSDNKGIVLPPRVAENKVAIVPILFEDTKKEVLKKANELKKELSELNPILDDREGYSPGWKFNELELKGIPLRIEIGPKDLKAKQVILARRDTGEKKVVKIAKLNKEVDKALGEMQNDLYKKAEKMLKESIQVTNSQKEFQTALKDKKFVKAPFCNKPECEDSIKEKSDGAKSILIPFENLPKGKKCVGCNKTAEVWCYFAKSY